MSVFKYRRAVTVAAVSAVLVGMNQLDPPRAVAAAGGKPVKGISCNGQKAAKIGCPIPQQTCTDGNCGFNHLNCRLRFCWTVQKTYTDYFACAPLNVIDLPRNSLCYMLVTHTRFGGIPTLRPCLAIQYCKIVGFICQPDPDRTGFKPAIVYGTSNDCVSGS